MSELVTTLEKVGVLRTRVQAACDAHRLVGTELQRWYESVDAEWQRLYKAVKALEALNDPSGSDAAASEKAAT